MTPIAGTVQPGEKVSVYSVVVWCPQCGGTLTHHASGRPDTDARAVAKCEPCKRVYGLTLSLRDVTGEVLSEKAIRMREMRARRKREAGAEAA